MSRIDELNQLNINHVVDALGLPTNRDRLDECPFCANTSGGCGAYKNRLRCFSCGVRATNTQLVAHDLGVAADSEL